ncbi:MAG: carboxypeptidase regulatory-like domain-containing protein [Planctomycetes bacterium]|nr:carboxypeptidase regulatory-like domain-containing protein [Planctomycetota bacterium]
MRTREAALLVFVIVASAAVGLLYGLVPARSEEDRPPSSLDGNSARAQHAASSKQVAEAPGRGALERAAEMQQKSIYGVVTDESGAPISGASVCCFDISSIQVLSWEDAWAPTGGLPQGRSDSSGRFSIGSTNSLSPSSLLATAPGFCPKLLEPAFPGEEVRFVLVPEFTAKGFVRGTGGEPIDGARVKWNEMYGIVQRTREAITAPDGSYRMAPVMNPRESSTPGAITPWVQVEARGYAPFHWQAISTQEWRTAEGDGLGELSRDFYLSRGMSLRGRVVEAETRRPVPLAPVELWQYGGIHSQIRSGVEMLLPSSAQCVAMVRTDRDGCFTFENAPAGGFPHPRAGFGRGSMQYIGFVGAVAEGRAPGAADVQYAQEGSGSSVEIQLAARGSARGRVRRSDGSGASGILVSTTELYWTRYRPYFQRVAQITATTDSEGSYLLDVVPAGEGKVSISTFQSRSILEYAQAQIDARPNETVEAPDLMLPNVYEISLTVMSETGSPVDGASVFPANGAKFDCRFVPGSSAGRLTVFIPKLSSIQPGDRLLIRRQGYSAAKSAPIDLSRLRSDLRVQLVPESHISGTVVLSDSRPASGARVRAFSTADLRDAKEMERVRLPRWSPSIPPVAEARADAAGRFMIHDLSEDTYILQALWTGPWESGYEPWSAVVPAVEGGIKDLIIRIAGTEALSSPHFLEVEILDEATGLPLPSAWGTLDLQGDQALNVQLIPAILRFAVVREGDYRLSVSCERYLTHSSEPIRLAPGGGTSRMSVRLRAGGVIRGTLRLAGQSADSFPTLKLVPHVDAGVTLPDAEGRFEFVGIPSGLYRIEADAEWALEGAPHRISPHEPIAAGPEKPPAQIELRTERVEMRDR